MVTQRRAPACCLTLTALLLMPSHAAAAVQDSQFWTQENAIVPLTAGLRLTLEQIARFSDRQGGLYTTEFGGLLGYRIAKGVELGIGYRHVGFYNGNTAADEDRIRQQVVVTAGKLVARLRLDERFHPGGSEIGFRIRPLLRFNEPIGSKGVQLFVSHESFYLPNATRWGQRRGYDRMRNATGIAFPISRALTADVGYLNQYRPPRSGSRAQMDHAFNMQLTFNFGAIAPPLLHD